MRELMIIGFMVLSSFGEVYPLEGALDSLYLFPNKDNSVVADREDKEDSFSVLEHNSEVKCSSCREEDYSLIDDFGFNPTEKFPLTQPNELNMKRKMSDDERIYVFVSWSMPLASLKKLAKEAKTQKAVLVFRGLKEDSFKKTIPLLKALGEGAIIDPLLFRENNISLVPTFLYAKNQHSGTLKGNVTLDFARRKIDEIFLLKESSSTEKNNASFEQIKSGERE